MPTSKPEVLVRESTRVPGSYQILRDGVSWNDPVERHRLADAVLRTLVPTDTYEVRLTPDEAKTVVRALQTGEPIRPSGVQSLLIRALSTPRRD